jgi:hypothetical protein
VSKPIRTAEDRKIASDAATGVLEVVVAVMEFFT